jgi:hypothetical protein
MGQGIHLGERKDQVPEKWTCNHHLNKPTTRPSREAKSRNPADKGPEEMRNHLRRVVHHERRSFK